MYSTTLDISFASAAGAPGGGEAQGGMGAVAEWLAGRAATATQEDDVLLMLLAAR
jgi:hypothetical protein